MLVLVRDEGLGTNRLFAAVTDETALVPCRACILQLPRTYQGNGGMTGGRDRNRKKKDGKNESEGIY